jgi:hypothetical protein
MKGLTSDENRSEAAENRFRRCRGMRRREFAMRPFLGYLMVGALLLAGYSAAPAVARERPGPRRNGHAEPDARHGTRRHRLAVAAAPAGLPNGATKRLGRPDRCGPEHRPGHRLRSRRDGPYSGLVAEPALLNPDAFCVNLPQIARAA